MGRIGQEITDVFDLYALIMIQQVFVIDFLNDFVYYS